MSDDDPPRHGPLPPDGQPDPLLREGPARPWWKWTVLLVIVILIGVVIYSITVPGPQKQGLMVPASAAIVTGVEDGL
jgi:hypothetical protein